MHTHTHTCVHRSAVFTHMRVYENTGPNIVPQVMGFPYDKDSNKVPLSSETPV